MAMMCDGHVDCYDEYDERDCGRIAKVYQILRFGVDSDSITESSLVLHWWLPTSTSAQFDFLPAYRVANSPTSPWVNTTWISKNEYRFTGLRPYTIYNMTVYVRNTQTHEVFPPGKFVSATTAEAEPEAPWNVTAKQLSAYQVQVRWLPPHQPNGPLSGYTVCMTPPIPPLCKNVHASKTETLIDSDFNAQFNYSFWVKAKNSVFESNSSAVSVLRLDESARLDPIMDLTVLTRTKNSVKLSWTPVKHATKYHVNPRALSLASDSILFPQLSTIEAESPLITVGNLAPGMDYTFEVIPYNKNFEGRAASITTRTEGAPLPQVSELHVEVLKSQGTSVKVGWTPPTDARKVAWEYGVYYGVTLKELLSKGAAVRTTNTSVTVRDLSACESYVFSVGVVAPLGVGPLSSSPQTVVTQFSPRAPPKNLRVLPDAHNNTAMSITWSASCPLVSQDIAYEMTITEVNLGLSASYTIQPSRLLDLQHTLYIQYGGRYNVCVSTSVRGSLPGPCQEYWAKPLPSPHQLQVIQDNNGSHVLYWRQDQQPANLTADQYHYVLLVSTGSSLNMTSAQQIKVRAAPYIFNPGSEEATYSYAVVLETEQGYRSLPSEVVSLASVKASWGAVFQEKSVLSIVLSSLLVVAVICCLLAVALGLVAIRHRRLQHTFSSFANSHFSTRSGTATFGNSDGLEDEDSPVIRGFSDDEPLVIA